MRITNSVTERRTIRILLYATLITSAVHFADNAFHLDMYPGPAWLTRKAILLTWLTLPLLAAVAYRVGTRSAFIAYAALGFAGFAHYLAPHAHPIAPRCLATIVAEALASAALIVFVARPGIGSDKI